MFVLKNQKYLNVHVAHFVSDSVCYYLAVNNVRVRTIDWFYMCLSKLIRSLGYQEDKTHFLQCTEDESPDNIP